MIGASIIKATGKTTPPQAARFVSGFASLATTALSTIGSSDIRIQLAARGHQVCTILLEGSGVISRGCSIAHAQEVARGDCVTTRIIPRLRLFLVDFLLQLGDERKGTVRIRKIKPIPNDPDIRNFESQVVKRRIQRIVFLAK